jgi:hypothetical protein
MMYGLPLTCLRSRYVSPFRTSQCRDSLIIGKRLPITPDKEIPNTKYVLADEEYPRMPDVVCG